MSEHLPSDVRDAIDAALVNQLEHLQYQLDHSVATCIEDCRSAIHDWTAEETLVMEVSMDHRIELIEAYSDRLGLEFESVSLQDLRNRIDGTAALIVSHFGAECAFEVIDEIEELLTEHELELDSVKKSHSFGCFRPYAVRDEDPWTVYEYRNLEGEGLHVDLYEYTVAKVRFYVERWLQKGSRPAEEESWDAS